MAEQTLIQAIRSLNPASARASELLERAILAITEEVSPLTPVTEEYLPANRMSSLPGLLITLEGGDGSGKTTAGKLMIEMLLDEGVEVLAMREPGGTEVGEQIRDILLNSLEFDINPRCEALLFAANRAENGQEILEPALRRGAFIIVDRFCDSSAAYQGHGRGLGIPDIINLSRYALDGLWPNRTLLLEISPEEAVLRREKRRGAASDTSKDRIERSGDAFLEKVMEGYSLCAEAYPERVKVIQADGSPEQVALKLIASLTDLRQGVRV